MANLQGLRSEDAPLGSRLEKVPIKGLSGKAPAALSMHLRKRGTAGGPARTGGWQNS